jgi:transposase InsO family protein
MYGIDTGSGGEFTSRELLQWRGDNRIEFTRGRPYRKNGNCFVEQKNRDAVRKTAGYFRYDTRDELDALAEVYRCLCPPRTIFTRQPGLPAKSGLKTDVTKKYMTSRKRLTGGCLNPPMSAMKPRRN